MEAGGDEELLRSVAAGDAGALGRLYTQYRRPLFGYLQRLAGDRMVAEEILQDTMLAVWRSAAAFEGRAKVSTWLFGVARRQAHNRLRGRGAPTPAGAELPERADLSAGPEELAIAAAGGTPVAAAIDRLPEHHRDVIALVFVAGLPLADVAEVLAIPVGTVKSRLYHARAAVVAQLTAQEVTE
ncbi:RNA polymerase sigma factor [Dactylosporangium sp. NPDC051541]|uniref:RNA polymerase sigma factor n=1 Tax=Dactylosporangium sp. NPDC051541 TaxID=3363977 RepID=UPI0037BDB037